MSEVWYLSKDEQDEKSQKAQHKLGDWHSLIYLIALAKESWPLFVLSLLALLSSTCMVIFSARLIGQLVEKGLIEKNGELAFELAIQILVLETASLILLWLGRRGMSRAASRTILVLRTKLFHYLQDLPLSFYDRQPQGRIVTRVTHDVEGLEEFFTSTLGKMINALLVSALALGAMMATDSILGSLMLFFMLPTFLFVYLTRHQVRRVNRRMSVMSSQVNALLSEFISGIDVIRSFGLEPWSKRNFTHKTSEQLDAHLKANFLYAWSRPLISLLCSLPLLGLIWFGGKQVLAASMSVGLFVTFIRYCERFYMPVLTIAREFHVVQQAFSYAERVVSFLKHSTESEHLGQNGHRRTEILGHIEFKNVEMSYEKNHPVLNGVTFEVLAGEKVGIVGRTGSGKTSIISLLLRLYPFQKGQIFLDSTEIQDYDRHFLRKQIGIVSQEVTMFKGSLYDNLMLGQSYSHGQVKKACELTGLEQIFEQRGLRFEDELIDDGANLSAGEKQLLSLTRILLKNPKILILDEATANIDPYYESNIERAIDVIMKERTCFMVAHRLSTLEKCDKIIALKDGRVLEIGHPHDLLKKQGYYYQLYQAYYSRFKSQHDNERPSP